MSDESFEHEKYLQIFVPKDLSLDKGWELEALLRTVEEAIQTAQGKSDGKVYSITVEAPAVLDKTELENLFDAVATAAHKIEERFPNRTWDVFVAGGVLSEEHSAEAAFRRVFDEREELQEQLDEARQLVEGWRGALVTALGLEESAPLPEMDELIGRATVVRAGGERWKSELDLAEQRLEALRTEFRKGLGHR